MSRGASNKTMFSSGKLQTDGRMPSLFEVMRLWWRMKQAERCLARGRSRDAAERFAELDMPAWLMRARLAEGKTGAARKVMKETLASMESRLGGMLAEAERRLMADAVRGEGKPVPLHLLAQMPRHVPGSFEIDGVRLKFPDGPSAGSAYQEIFVKRMYDIPTVEAPRILDGGANIGLAAVFFKMRHARARVTCFEADPAVAVYLRRNLEAAGAGETDVVEAALWGEDGELSFAAEGSDAGRVSEGSGLKVKAVRLSPYLNEPVDLLKLDIEGAEAAVLRECRGALGLVKRLFVEYHSFEGQPQCLDELLGILREAGFRVTITVSDTLTWRPFLERGSSLGMDMRLNLFGVRES
jgi:FkbM family methyltransferase